MSYGLHFLVIISQSGHNQEGYMFHDDVASLQFITTTYDLFLANQLSEARASTLIKKIPEFFDLLPGKKGKKSDIAVDAIVLAALVLNLALTDFSRPECQSAALNVVSLKKRWLLFNLTAIDRLQHSPIEGVGEQAKRVLREAMEEFGPGSRYEVFAKHMVDKMLRRIRKD